LTRAKSLFALTLFLWALALGAQRTHLQPRHTPTQRVTGRVDLIRISAQENSMTVSELFLLDEDLHTANQNNVFPFTIFVPSAAVIRECIVENRDGEAVRTNLSPAKAAGEFVMQLPYKPAATKAQVIYELPYFGSMDFEARPSVMQETLAVMVPKSIRFESETKSFEAVKSDQTINVYVVKNVKASQRIRFRLRGYGDLPKNAEGPKVEAQASSTATETGKKTSQATQTIWILIAVVLTVGIGIATWRRHTRASTLARLDPTPQDSLTLLREKLFELETAKLRGEIPPEVYQKRQAEIRLRIRRLLKS